MADDFHLKLTAEERRVLTAILTRVQMSEDAAREERAKKRKPGMFKGLLEIGPEFFEPLTDEEINELTGE